MSEHIPESDSTEPERATEGTPQGPPPTPFDHPLFLPALLFAGVLWFGYDGWLSSDPAMLEHQTFNQVGFAILVVLLGWFGYKGYQEWQEDKAKAAEGSSTHPFPPTGA